MQISNSPICKTLDISLHLPVDVLAPAGEVLPIFFELLHGHLEEIADEVERSLHVEILLTHGNHNEIVDVATCLLFVEGEEVLE